MGWLVVKSFASGDVTFYFHILLQSDALCGSEADKAHIWRIAITEFLFSAFVSFAATAFWAVPMFKTAYLRSVADDLRVWVPMADSLAGWIDNLGLLLNVDNTVLDPVLSHVAYGSGHQVD